MLPNSHKPHTIHPNAHTPEELKWIMDLHRRNKDISVCEMYTKLREKHAYSRHPGSLYRVFVRLGYRKKVESTKEKSKHNGHYDTPTKLGVKWQMDVKYVPSACYVGTDGEKFYQYTMIDEASRERFIFPYKEQSSYSMVMRRRSSKPTMARSSHIRPKQTVYTRWTCCVYNSILRIS